ncbi:hypothetical protein ACOME3_001632 [Neoechinorhynchus agilis]
MSTNASARVSPQSLNDDVPLKPTLVRSISSPQCDEDHRPISCPCSMSLCSQTGYLLVASADERLVVYGLAQPSIAPNHFEIYRRPQRRRKRLCHRPLVKWSWHTSRSDVFALAVNGSGPAGVNFYRKCENGDIVSISAAPSSLSTRRPSVFSSSILLSTNKYVTAMDWSSIAQNYFASSYSDGFTFVWDYRDVQVPFCRINAFWPVVRSHWSSFNSNLINVAAGRRVLVYDIRNTGRHLTCIDTDHDELVDMDWNRFNQNRVVTAGRDGKIKLWYISRMGTYKRCTIQLLPNTKKSRIDRVSFYPGSNTVVATTTSSKRSNRGAFDDYTTRLNLIDFSFPPSGPASYSVRDVVGASGSGRLIDFEFYEDPSVNSAQPDCYSIRSSSSDIQSINQSTTQMVTCSTDAILRLWPPLSIMNEVLPKTDWAPFLDENIRSGNLRSQDGPPSYEDDQDSPTCKTVPTNTDDMVRLELLAIRNSQFPCLKLLKFTRTYCQFLVQIDVQSNVILKADYGPVIHNHRFDFQHTRRIEPVFTLSEPVPIHGVLLRAQEYARSINSPRFLVTCLREVSKALLATSTVTKSNDPVKKRNAQQYDRSFVVCRNVDRSFKDQRLHQIWMILKKIASCTEPTCSTWSPAEYKFIDKVLTHYSQKNEYLTVVLILAASRLVADEAFFDRFRSYLPIVERYADQLYQWSLHNRHAELIKLQLCVLFQGVHYNVRFVANACREGYVSRNENQHSFFCSNVSEEKKRIVGIHGTIKVFENKEVQCTHRGPVNGKCRRRHFLAQVVTVDGSGRNKSPKKSFTFLKKGEGIARFRNPVIKNYENEDEDFFLIKRDHASWNDNQYSKNMNSVENRTFVNMDKQDDGKVNEIEQIDASLKEWDVLSEDELDAETEGLSKEAKQRLNDWFNANMPEKITIDKSKSREQLETGSLQKTLKTKIAQLEQTMNAFSRENRVLLKLMRDNEEAKHRLQEDRTVFEKQRKVELEKFKDWKKRENERLTKENEKLEEKVKQMKSECTNGEYVKQIESLNSRINGLKLEIKQKERSYVMNESKLKTKIVELERENGELKGRAKTLETRRNELASKLNALQREMVD